MELRATPRKSQEKLAPGMIPAVAYSKEKNVTFAIERKAFDRAFRQQGTTGLFDIVIEGGETFPALVKTVQMDKRRREAIHADFYMVTYGQPVEVTVPVHTTGKAQGEIQGGLVDVVVHNLNVIAPGPRRIPQEITVDVTALNIGDHVTAGQIKLPEGVKLAVEEDLVVISVLPPRLTAEELAAEQQAAQVAGLVAAGEISPEAAEAVLEGAASVEEVKTESQAQQDTEEASERANQGQ
ncbi:50S ribosomal protein L25/general stress protein Ctc [Deinococcus sp. YIM 77859]|uniref:50S ribosomal protein L25/general stress protein Ctc n=1 Tax=Deinococcus sp. YIM 77859 TaxID=1540221 RepID=UPI00055369A8|nr:50S ribosomal protein L25/general stress protein Ctc [Deinococcus sp. YIM 77859]